MSTAIAMAPSPAPHDRPPYAPDTQQATPESSSVGSGGAQRTVEQEQRSPPQPQPSGSEPRADSTPSRTLVATPARASPSSGSRKPGPRIIVKKEPGSPPDLSTERHRPKRLDLSKGAAAAGNGPPGTARPMTARDGGLGIQEVGIACLSPGFVTHDPIMKEQLQRSMSVREQQRHLIEARLQQQSAKGDGPADGKGGAAAAADGQFAAKTPGMLSRRNRAPEGLSIIAPSHEQFANERVIQSAPLGQTFTGRHHPHPLTRHVANQSSSLAGTSHIHHVPATQTNNRLPPISDVFSQGIPGHSDGAGGGAGPGRLYPGGTAPPPHTSRASLASPNPHHAAPSHGPTPTPRPTREYRSAEEAQADLAGGRPELLPKLVHYPGNGGGGGGGHHPPTPPTPRGLEGGGGGQSTGGAIGGGGGGGSNSRRRGRAEYEEGATPPLGHGPSAVRRGPFGAGHDGPETPQAKKEEFLRLCERAWDLFHS